MREDDWAALGSEWRAIEASAPAPDLAARVQRTLRLRRLGLYSELLGTALALSTIVFAIVRGVDLAGGMLWLVGVMMILLVWQALHLAIRHAYGLFAAPEAGLAGWIEAERRRARYVIAYHWLGLVGGVVVLAWAQQTIAFLDDPVAAKAFSIAGVLLLGWSIARTWALRRLLARLAEERAALEG